MQEVLRLEQAILGSFVVDPAAREFSLELSDDDFLDNSHKKIFKAIRALADEGQDFSYFELAQKSGLSILNISGLTDMVTTTARIENEVNLLKDKSSRRRLLEKAEYIKELAMNKELDIDTIKNNAMQEIEEVKVVMNDGVVSLKEAMLDTIEVLEKRAENKDDRSYHTRVGKLDVATAGLHPEELTTIAARPGVGKTAIAMQIGLNIASNKRKVMMTSLEMSSVQLCQRIIAANSGLDGNDLRRGNLDGEGWRKTMDVGQMFATENFIIDKTSKKPQHIRSKIRKHKPDLVIIDYLQLLQPDEKLGSREQEVSSMTRALKLMTLEFKIPIIILSQLNRNAEGKRPSLADLRESGAIEQDSDNIIFIHRLTNSELSDMISEGIYSIDFLEEMKTKGNVLADVILEKQRNGPTGSFGMVYVPKLMKFIGLDK